MSATPGTVVRRRVSTNDPDEADAAMQAYARFRAEPTVREGFEFTLDTASVGPCAMSTLRHSARFRAQTSPPDAVTVTEALDGHVWMVRGREETSGSVMVAPDRSSYVSGWENIHARMTTFERGPFLRLAAELAGCEPAEVTFGAMNPRSEALARYWSALTGHVQDHLLADDALAAPPLLRTEALRSLVVGVLTVFPNSTLDLPRRGGPDSGEPATVRRAVEFIDAHAAEDISVTQIADAARLGPRGLQAAFRRHRDQTPLEYLREVRMAGSDRDLRAADPTAGETVAGIAARWGFAHPGRFSVDYRRLYGCSPSETLRR